LALAEPLIVSINDRGQLFLNLGADEKQALELATIRQRVAAVLRRTPDKPVLVWGDQKVAYGDVVVVMTALQEAGAPTVGLVTESPAGN
jgi:biopolymer transport protein TolR